jgi:hypothetical protein
MSELGPYGRYVDKCMKLEVRRLNKDGFKTLGCCCGHNKYPKTMIILWNTKIYEYYSGKNIPRTRNFYKIDKEGIYYIPEVIAE